MTPKHSVHERPVFAEASVIGISAAPASSLPSCAGEFGCRCRLVHPGIGQLDLSRFY